jgi:HlyD family secretion protein
MASSPMDLRALRGVQGGPVGFKGATVRGEGGVPRPASRRMTRLVVPLALLVSTGVLVAYSARDALRPGVAVYVAAAVPKPSAAVAPDGAGAAAGSAGEEASSAPDSRLGALVVQAPGWVEPSPYASIVPALAEGVVREVLVLEGDRVEAGQVVARLIDDDARLMVRAAEASVAQRAADVARARAALSTAEAQVPVQRSAADELRDEVTRSRDLVAVGGFGAGEFRRMEIRLGGLEASVDGAERAVLEARAAVEQAETSRQAALVALDEARLRLSRMEVRTEAAGVVLARLVEPGSRISLTNDVGGVEASSGRMGAVLRVYDPSKLQVRVDVPLAEAAKVGVGTRAIVESEALADRTFTGVVVRVVHEANIQRNTVQFKVTIDDPSPVLKPEMLARVRLHGPAAGGSASGASGSGASGSSSFTLLVPVSAVVPVGEGRCEVWTVDTGGRGPVAGKRAVVTGAASDEGLVEVTSGLRLTDRVIVDPGAVTGLREGVRLRVMGERAAAASGEGRTP